MERWLKVTGNDHGEWSVLDLERNYRVCSFNHSPLRGVHLHHNGKSHPIEIESLAEAQQVVREYAIAHETFDIAGFEELLNEWKSEPNTG